MASPAKRAATITLLIAAVGLFYASTYDFREVTDNRVNSLSTRALVTHGDVNVGRYRLPRLAFARPHDDDLYSVYGVGLSLIAAPIYAPAVRLARSEAVLQGLVAIPFCAVAVVAMLLLLEDLLGDKRIAVAGAIAFGFGTTMWPLASMAFYSHGIAAIFEILGFMGFFSKTRRGPAIAGLGLGVAMMVRPTTFTLVVAAGALYVLSDRRALARFALGVAPSAAVILVQNRWLWGSWTHNGYAILGVGFHGAVPPDLWRLTFGFWRGLFIYSPFLLLALVGAFLCLRNVRGHVERRLLSLGSCCIASLVLYAGFTTWWGGLAQFGYRYLLDVVPALVVLAAYAAHRRPALIIPAGFLTALSVLTMAFGSVQKYGAFDNNLFPRSFSDAPIGQAWISAIHAPLGPVIRLAGLGLLAILLARGLRSLEHDRIGRPRSAPT